MGKFHLSPDIQRYVTFDEQAYAREKPAVEQGNAMLLSYGAREGKCDCTDAGCPHKMSVSPLALMCVAQEESNAVLRHIKVDLDRFNPHAYPILVCHEDCNDFKLDKEYGDRITNDQEAENDDAPFYYRRAVKAWTQCKNEYISIPINNGSYNHMDDDIIDGFAFKVASRDEVPKKMILDVLGQRCMIDIREFVRKTTIQDGTTLFVLSIPGIYVWPHELIYHQFNAIFADPCVDADALYCVRGAFFNSKIVKMRTEQEKGRLIHSRVPVKHFSLMEEHNDLSFTDLLKQDCTVEKRLFFLFTDGLMLPRFK